MLIFDGEHEINLFDLSQDGTFAKPLSDSIDNMANPRFTYPYEVHYDTEYRLLSVTPAWNDVAIACLAFVTNQVYLSTIEQCELLKSLRRVCEYDHGKISVKHEPEFGDDMRVNE